MTASSLGSCCECVRIRHQRHVEARLVLDDIQHESALTIMDTAASLANIFSPPLRTFSAINTLLVLVSIAILFVPAPRFGKLHGAVAAFCAPETLFEVHSYG